MEKEIEKLAITAYPIEKDTSEEAKNKLLRMGFIKGYLAKEK